MRLAGESTTRNIGKAVSKWLRYSVLELRPEEESMTYATTRDAVVYIYQSGQNVDH